MATQRAAAAPETTDKLDFQKLRIGGKPHSENPTYQDLAKCFDNSFGPWNSSDFDPNGDLRTR